MKDGKKISLKRLIVLLSVFAVVFVSMPTASIAAPPPHSNGSGTVTDNVWVFMEYKDSVKVGIPWTKVEAEVSKKKHSKGYTDENGYVQLKQKTGKTDIVFELPEEWKSKVELKDALWKTKYLGVWSSEKQLMLHANRVSLGYLPLKTELELKIFLAAKKFNVEFDTNGGNYISTTAVEYLRKAAEPATPTKEGYIFEGWYLNGVKFDFSTPIKENIRLVAKWREIPVEFSEKYNPKGKNVEVELNAPIAPEDFVEPDTAEGYAGAVREYTFSDGFITTDEAVENKEVKINIAYNDGSFEEVTGYLTVIEQPVAVSTPVMYFVCKSKTETAAHDINNFVKLELDNSVIDKTKVELLWTVDAEGKSVVENEADLDTVRFNEKSRAEFETEATALFIAKLPTLSSFTDEQKEACSNSSVKIYRIVDESDGLHVDLKLVDKITGGDSTPPSGGGDSTPPSGGGDSTPPSGGGDSTPPSGGGDSTPPSGGGDSTPPSGGGDSTPPSGGGDSTPPSGGGDSTPPSGGGDSTPPSGGGDSTPPSGGGDSTPPSGGGDSTPPSGGGDSTPPSGGGDSTPPSGGGDSTPPSGGGDSTPPSGGGDSTPPSVAGDTTPTQDTEVVSIETDTTPLGTATENEEEPSLDVVEDNTALGEVVAYEDAAEEEEDDGVVEDAVSEAELTVEEDKTAQGVATTDDSTGKAPVLALTGGAKVSVISALALLSILIFGYVLTKVFEKKIKKQE